MNIAKSSASLLKLATQQKAFLAILALLLLMAFSKSHFYSMFNLMDMLNSTSILLILAFGVTLTVVSGACDLSIGGILVVSGIVAIKLMEGTLWSAIPALPMWMSILLALLLGALIGAIN